MLAMISKRIGRMKKKRNNIMGWGKFFHPFVIVKIKKGGD